MHAHDLILAITGGLGALYLGYFTQRLGLSPIFGDILTVLGATPEQMDRERCPLPASNRSPADDGRSR